MAYSPIYDGEFDLAIDHTDGKEVCAFLEAIAKHKLMLINWLTDGPGGGNPACKLRGTRRQFVAWMNDYYDRDRQCFERDLSSDAQTWVNLQEEFDIHCVA